MFTFSRSTNQITIVFAVFAGLFFSSVSAAEAGGLRLTPAKQTVRAGSKAGGLAAGRRCSMRLPSHRLIRINGRQHWAWTASRPGRFQVRMRCGRKLARVLIVVKPKAKVSKPNVWTDDQTDPVDNNPEDSSQQPATPSQPSTSMTPTELNFWFYYNCHGSAKRAAAPNCQKAIAIKRERKFGDTRYLFKNSDATHPYGNPYDTSNGGGICMDWVKYKRPDIYLDILKTYWETYWNSGEQPEVVGKLEWVGGQDNYPTKLPSGWTRWAKQSGHNWGLTPKVGAILVQGNGGHVAYVEKVYPPNEYEKSIGITYGGFTVSQTNWNGKPGVVDTRSYSSNPESTKRMQGWFVY